MVDIALLIFLFTGSIWLSGFVFFKAADYFDLRRDNSPAKMRVRRYASQAVSRK